MKKVKKIFAALLALTMVLGMGVTTLAAPHKPIEGDGEKVTIQNVEPDATYKAYQIIDATYNDKGFTGYVWAPGTDKAGEAVKITSENAKDPNLTQVEGLNSTTIGKLASNPSVLENQKLNFDPSKDKLEVGTWMILVTPPATDPTKSYNPMIVSVYYTVGGTGQNNDQVPGSVNANDNWKLATTGAYVKSNDTENQEDKTVTKPTDEVGNVVEFKLTGVIPSYSKEYYTNPVYKLTDTIQNGLSYVTLESKDLESLVSFDGLNDEQLKAAMTVSAPDALGMTKNDYKIAYTKQGGENKDKESFSITFEPTFIQKVADKTPEQRKVEVTYYAQITESAITALGKNEFKITYSNKSGDDGTADTKGDDEYVYTLSLDGVLKKVDETHNSQTLSGATFTLYTDEALTEDAKFGTSNETGGDGNIQFKGLDGEKTYYLRETTAPEGYSLNATVYKIEFFDLKFESDATNKLKTYKVRATPGVVKDVENPEGETAKKWEANGEAAFESAVINYGETADLKEAYPIKDTKLSSLPSTGGIGTTIFTIGGCALMIIAAGLYFATRRKNAK